MAIQPTQLGELPEDSFSADRSRPVLFTTMWPREDPKGRVLDVDGDILFSPAPGEVLQLLALMDQAGRQGSVRSGPALEMPFQALGLTRPAVLQFGHRWQEGQEAPSFVEQFFSFSELMEARQACEDREYMISVDPDLIKATQSEEPVSKEQLTGWQVSCHYNCIQLKAEDQRGIEWYSTGNLFRQELLAYQLYSTETRQAGQKVIEEVIEHGPWLAAHLLASGLSPEFGKQPSRDVQPWSRPEFYSRLLDHDNKEVRQMALRASKEHMPEGVRPSR